MQRLLVRKIVSEKKADYMIDNGIIAKPREEITISMPNGKEEKGTSWETTPGAIARGISKSLFERTVISMVDGELWDLTRPLEKSCKLELIDFENIEGMTLIAVSRSITAEEERVLTLGKL